MTDRTAKVTVRGNLVHSAERAARGNRDVRSMAPSQRRETSDVSQPASGNASSGVRTRRSASARATCPTPPTQISTPSPKSSCAPSREPCSATRCLCRFGAHVREERHSVALSAQRSQGPAHASRPEQHEGDDDLGDAKRGSGLAGQAPGRDARRVGQSRASGAVEG